MTRRTRIEGLLAAHASALAGRWALVHQSTLHVDALVHLEPHDRDDGDVNELIEDASKDPAAAFERWPWLVITDLDTEIDPYGFGHWSHWTQSDNAHAHHLAEKHGISTELVRSLVLSPGEPLYHPYLDEGTLEEMSEELRAEICQLREEELDSNPKGALHILGERLHQMRCAALVWDSGGGFTVEKSKHSDLGHLFASREGQWAREEDDSVWLSLEPISPNHGSWEPVEAVRCEGAVVDGSYQGEIWFYVCGMECWHRMRFQRVETQGTSPPRLAERAQSLSDDLASAREVCDSAVWERLLDHLEDETVPAELRDEIEGVLRGWPDASRRLPRAWWLAHVRNRRALGLRSLSLVRSLRPAPDWFRTSLDILALRDGPWNATVSILDLRSMGSDTKRLKRTLGVLSWPRKAWRLTEIIFDERVWLKEVRAFFQHSPVYKTVRLSQPGASPELLKSPRFQVVRRGIGELPGQDTPPSQEDWWAGCRAIVGWSGGVLVDEVIPHIRRVASRWDHHLCTFPREWWFAHRRGELELPAEAWSLFRSLRPEPDWFTTPGDWRGVLDGPWGNHLCVLDLCAMEPDDEADVQAWLQLIRAARRPKQERAAMDWRIVVPEGLFADQITTTARLLGLRSVWVLEG